MSDRSHKAPPDELRRPRVAMRRVDSEAIEAIGYDSATRTLLVRFSGGALYAYFDVPPHDHAALLAAESLGGYFNRHLRERYPHRQLTDSR